jgi:hypothetical protein
MKTSEIGKNAALLSLIRRQYIQHAYRYDSIMSAGIHLTLSGWLYFVLSGARIHISWIETKLKSRFPVLSETLREALAWIQKN